MNRAHSPNLPLERGALSLIWCVVLVVLLSIAAMAGLFSIRYERNLFAEAGFELKKMTLVQTAQTIKASSGHAVKSDAASLRKCTVDGTVMYSNVECDAKNPTSRNVSLHDTQGFDAPQVLPPVSKQAAPARLDAQQRMIEQAIQDH